VIRVNNVLHYAHRLAYLYMLGEWPTDDIDHANGISSDNRWANLRPATRSQNLANKGKSPFNTSGFKGVSFCKTTDRWRAQIEVRGTPVHIGRYDTPEEAHAAYIEAAREYFGEFARAA
jgi:hypothetical protein